MTTAAYDGKMLAVDRQATNGTHKHQLPPGSKLFRIDFPGTDRLKYFAAFAGYLGDILPVVHWLRDGGTKPTLDEAGSFSALLVDAAGRTWRIENNLEPFEVQAPHAIGSGREFAIAAMRCGKNAEEAVLLASELDIYTGLGVDVRLVGTT